MVVVGLGALPEIFAGAFGISAAALLIGGGIALRWQSNQHRFTLMQTALERGVSTFPNAVPFWLLSLRQGVMILTLGIALIGIGAAGWAMGAAAPMPANISAQDTMQPSDEPPPPPPPGPGNEGPGRDGPGAFGNFRGGPRPRPNPELERWHRGQDLATTGMLAIACGIVLTLLGLVRVVFARMEKRVLATLNPASTGMTDAM